MNLWAITSWLLFTLAGASILFFILPPRRKDPSRCSQCRYDLQMHQDVCPECGFAVQNRPLPIRRRPSRLLVAILLAASGRSMLDWPGRASQGEQATRYIPTSVLAVLAPLAEPPGNEDALARAMRLRAGDAWSWQTRLHSALRLARTPAGIIQSCVRTRKAWPANSSPVIVLESTSETEPIVGSRHMRAELTDLNLTLEGSCGNSRYDQCFPTSSPTTLAFRCTSPCAPGNHFVPLQMTIIDDWGTARTVQSTFAFRIANPGEHVLNPISSESVSQLVASAISIETEGPRPGEFIVRLNSSKLGKANESVDAMREHRDLTIAVRIELLVDQHLIDSWSFVPDADVDPEQVLGKPDHSGFVNMALDRARNRWRSDVISRAVLKVSGDEKLACLKFDSQTYWPGTIFVPLRDVFNVRETDEDDVSDANSIECRVLLLSAER